MRLEWFSKYPVCKRPCWYMYLVFIHVQCFFCCSVHMVQTCNFHRLVFCTWKRHQDWDESMFLTLTECQQSVKHNGKVFACTCTVGYQLSTFKYAQCIIFTEFCTTFKTIFKAFPNGINFASFPDGEWSLLTPSYKSNITTWIHTVHLICTYSDTRHWTYNL